MRSIIIVDNPKDFDLKIEDVEVLSARSYLTDSSYAELRNIRVYNLCKSYRYQSVGYYVSLLAEARRHRVFPNIMTIQDIKSQTIFRVLSDEIEDTIQSDLADIKAKTFELCIYFRRTVDKEFSELGRQIFNLFQAPLLKATFSFNKKWMLQNINAIPINEIPDEHKQFVIEYAKDYFAKKRIRSLRKTNTIYDLAILVNHNSNAAAPSDKKTLQKFIDAAEEIGFSAELISKDDYSRIAEFDALFIRETTAVNHHTYKFSRRASTEGLVVIDDPISIVRCTNKVYLNEILTKGKIATPKTLIVHKHNIEAVVNELGLPLVLKQPDGSSSIGVIKVSSQKELENEIERMLITSDLIVAQEYTPTEFDWRICLLDRKPLFAAKYFMAKNHWQIYHWNGNRQPRWGEHVTVSLEEVPTEVISLAQKASNLIGDGLYGVDLKQFGNRTVVIEVNDNPNIDTGYEDKTLKDELYLTIMSSFMRRVQLSKSRKI